MIVLLATRCHLGRFENPMPRRIFCVKGKNITSWKAPRRLERHAISYANNRTDVNKLIYITKSIPMVDGCDAQRGNVGWEGDR